nr:hypothetical protein [Planctomycetota bacterium]
MAEELGNKREYKLSGWPMIIGWIAMLIFALHASTHMVGAGDTWVALACGRHFFNHGVDTVEPFSANSHEAGPNEQTMEKYANFLRSSLKDPEVKNSLNGRLTGWWLGKVESYPDWSEGTKGFVKKVHPTGWVNQNWLTHVIFYWLSHESPFADAEQLSFNTLVYWKFAIYILTIAVVYYSCRVLKVNEALSVVFACFALFVGRSFFDIRPAGFSNMLTAAFLLLLILGTYRNILYLWLIVPLTV